MLSKRSILASCVLTMLVLACSLSAGTPFSAPGQPALSPWQGISADFPLNRGAYWLYQGTVKWTKPDSSDVVEQEVTWKMQVEQALQRKDIAGYQMSGAPWDLAWYDPAKAPSKYGIVQVAGKFYRVPPETLSRLSNEGDDLANLVNEGSLFLDTPLEAGKKFGDPAFLSRSDHMYYWIVGEKNPFDASTIKGVAPSPDLWEYPLVMQTNPDISTVYFVPGVGISGYSYHHAGTVSDADVRLIEYSPGE